MHHLVDKLKNFCYNIYMKDKELKNIANRIIQLENACQNQDNISKNMSEMDKILSELSFQDLMAVLLLLEARESEIEIAQ